MRTETDDRSPYPWIADAIWRRTKDRREDPVLDARWAVSEELLVVAVSPEDQRRAPVVAVDENAHVPDVVGDLDEARALLQQAGGTGYTFPSAVTWLVCCDRLATLVDPPSQLAALPHLTEAEARSEWGSPGVADFSFMDAPPRARTSFWRRLFHGRDPIADYQALQRAAIEGTDGVHILQCLACGRLYLACHHP